MGWMDLSEYLLIEQAVSDRLADLRHETRLEGAVPSNATSTTSALGRPTTNDDEVSERLRAAA
jgi:hypothetical protein